MGRSMTFKSEQLETDHRSDSNFEIDASTAKKSNHHNFQKHTVTALKDVVKLSKF